MDLNDLERMIAHGDTTGALKALRQRRERIDEEWSNAYLSSLIDSKEYQLEQLAKELEWCVNQLCSHHPKAGGMKRVQRIRTLLAETT